MTDHHPSHAHSLAEDLRRISKAKEVKVQINGNRRRLHREFKEANFQKFRSFVLLHMGL